MSAPGPTITPYLYYKDVSAALDFLARAYGLSPVPGERIEDCEGVVMHAAMAFGDGRVLLGCPGPDYRPPAELGTSTQNLYVRVPDVRAHLNRARAAGAAIESGPEETFYGDLRYGTTDCEGHQWYFATALADLP